MPPRPAFWSSLFRNRRGNACCPCIVLVLVWTVYIGTWSAVCFRDGKFVEWKPGHIAGLTLVCGLKAWKDRSDARYPDAPRDAR